MLFREPCSKLVNRAAFGRQLSSPLCSAYHELLSPSTPSHCLRSKAVETSDGAVVRAIARTATERMAATALVRSGTDEAQAIESPGVRH
jgi:hypothetical protein